MTRYTNSSSSQEEVERNPRKRKIQKTSYTLHDVLAYTASSTLMRESDSTDDDDHINNNELSFMEEGNNNNYDVEDDNHTLTHKQYNDIISLYSSSKVAPSLKTNVYSVLNDNNVNNNSNNRNNNNDINNNNNVNNSDQETSSSSGYVVGNSSNGSSSSYVAYTSGPNVESSRKSNSNYTYLTISSTEDGSKETESKDLYSVEDETTADDKEEEEDEDDNDKSTIDKIKQLTLEQKRMEQHQIGGRNWNQEYQGLLLQPYSMEKYNGLSLLAMDFVSAAERYGTTIIKEKGLPRELQTIPSIDIGGVAGGQKYIWHNILFKFAQDPMITKDNYLYGGNTENTIGASKAAGNELRALSYFFQNVFETNVAHIVNVPLMCIIDYYGYRLIACSVLPINKKTIVYGSNDGGQQVHADIPELNLIMETIGKSMNLKGHLAGSSSPKFVYGPGDLEVHKSLINGTVTSKYYALDFGRLLPPIAFLNEKKEALADRSIFYKHFRPEFVKQYTKPLSSDAFSGWSFGDPEKRENNQDVTDATIHLYENVIAQVAISFDKVWNTQSTKFTENEWNLLIELHQHGINARLLGKLRSQTTNQRLRKHILNEMIARLFKNQFKSTHQINNLKENGDRKSSYLSEGKWIHATVEYINSLFSINKFNQDMSVSATKNNYFYGLIKRDLVIKYGDDGGLNQEEKVETYNLCDSFDLYTVFQKFQNMTGLKLSHRFLEAIRKGTMIKQSFPITNTDIIHWTPIIKHSHSVAQSQGIALYLRALELININRVRYAHPPIIHPNIGRFSTDYSEEWSILEQCRDHLLEASKSNTTDSSLYHLLGLIDFTFLKIINSGEPINHLVRAELNLLQAIRLSSSPIGLIHSHITLASIYSIWVLEMSGGISKMEIAQQIYEKITKTMLNEVTLPQFLSLMFESISVHSSGYNLRIPSNHRPFSMMVCHQLYVLLDILRPLANNHPLKQKYLHLVYKLFGAEVLLYKFKFVHLLVNLHELRLKDRKQDSDVNMTSPDTEIADLSNEDKMAMYYGMAVFEPALEYDPSIFDEYISKKRFITSLIIISKYSNRLKSRIQQYLDTIQLENWLIGEGKRDREEELENLYKSKQAMHTLLFTYNYKFEKLYLFGFYYPTLFIPTCQHLQHLQHLTLESISNLTTKPFLSDSFIQLSRSPLSKTLISLALTHLTFGPKQLETLKEGDGFTALKNLVLGDIVVYWDILSCTMQTSKSTIETLDLNICLEGDRTAIDFSIYPKLCQFNYNSSHGYLPFTKFPPNLESIIINGHDKLNVDQFTNFVSTTSSTLKTFITIGSNSVLGPHLHLLSAVPLVHLDLSGFYSNFIESNDLCNSIKLSNWSKSLRVLKFYPRSEPYNQEMFIKFLTSFKLLEELFLEKQDFDDYQYQQTIPNLLNLEKLTIKSNLLKLAINCSSNTNQNHNLLTTMIHSNIKKFKLMESTRKEIEYSIIPLMFPNLETLSLRSSEIGVGNTQFSKMVDNMARQNSNIKSLSLAGCRSLTDEALIYLSNKKEVVSKLVKFKILNTNEMLSDSGYIKLIMSASNLRVMNVDLIQNRVSESFVTSQYPNLKLSIRLV